MNERYDALALFSGGLDSILACKVLQAQGRSVLGLHFTSPFFGRPEKIAYWRTVYGIEVAAFDIGAEYVDMLAEGPPHGYGSLLNPCLDCKIMMLARARELLGRFGAGVLISGEVLGQRPMSQRRDALNLIRNAAGVRDVLVRPLCAKRLEPTPAELDGRVDRERLLAISGRGRKEQLRLAREFGITEMPTPAGGCRLTEAESASRYLRLLQAGGRPGPEDFQLCHAGRHFWFGAHWLVVGRNQANNERLLGLARDADALLKLKDLPGPLGVLRRPDGLAAEDAALASAAALVASYSGKARAAGGPAAVLVKVAGQTRTLTVTPARAEDAGWSEPDLSGLKDWKAAAPSPFAPRPGREPE
jgi:hypothetical protein